MGYRYMAEFKHDGRTIGLTGSGLFEVDFGEGRCDHYDTKARAEEAIDRHRKTTAQASKEKVALAVIVSTNRNGTFYQTPATVTGLHVTTRALTFQGYKHEAYVNEEVYPASPAVEALLKYRAGIAKLLAIAEKALGEIKITGASGYSKIAPDEYGTLLAGLRKRYNAAKENAEKIAVPTEVAV